MTNFEHLKENIRGCQGEAFKNKNTANTHLKLILCKLIKNNKSSANHTRRELLFWKVTMKGGKIQSTKHIGNSCDL